MALKLEALPIDTRPLPGLDPAGRQRFPFQGEPEGVEAELLVGNLGGKSTYAHMLTLQIKADKPSQPYVVHGASRFAPEAGLTFWTDSDGKLRQMVLMTNLDIAGDNQAYGFDVNTGRHVEGLMYHLDLDTGDWSVKTHGIDRGSSTDWLDPPVLRGEPFPRLDAVEGLSGGLLSRYLETVKSEEGDSK
jgi:hypothetical protein